MVAEWISCLDKRPADRSGEDLDIIYSRLKDIKALEKFHPLLLQQICYYGYYEDLEKGVTLFRQGDVGTNWYTVLSGSLEVTVCESGNIKDAVTLCILGAGTSFGEAILTNRPHHATVITRDYTELIRVEQKDFKILWDAMVAAAKARDAEKKRIENYKEIKRASNSEGPGQSTALDKVHHNQSLLVFPIMDL